MRKRMLSTLMALCMVLGMLPGTANASNIIIIPATGGFIGYNPATKYVTYCDKRVTAAVIPTEAIGISRGAFENCKLLSSIVIPDGLTDLGHLTFSGCSSLTTVTIPKNVTLIGYHVFEDCTSLTSITIPNGVTEIRDDAFKGCTSLSNITIPDTVKSIGGGAFMNCTSLENMIIPENVAILNTGVFEGCTNLNQIYLSDTVTVIREDAFAGCDNLRDVYYEGSEEQWNQIYINTGNLPLINAARHHSVPFPDQDLNPDDSTSFTPDNSGFENFRHIETYKNNFSDIKSDVWYYEDVVAAYELGLMTGLDADRFAPSDNVSVAQILALACRLRSIYLDDGYTFEASSPWYLTYADYAMNLGLITDWQPSRYNMPATRNDLAEILDILPKEMLSPVNQIQSQSIPNVTSDNINKRNIYTLYRAGIIRGNDSKGTFLPQSTIQRSEIAAIIARIANPDLRSRFNLSTEYVTLYADSGKSLPFPSWEVNRYIALGWQRAPFEVPADSSPSKILNSATLTPMLTNWKPLDDLVAEIFEQIFTDKMTTYDKLKACYDYLIEHTVYGHRGDPSLGITGKAYDTLTTGVGSCSDYSAAFLVMARRIGLDAYVVAGETSKAGGGYTDHVWNIITIGGVDYVFDAQVEDNIAKGGKIQYYRFCKAIDQVTRNYRDYDISKDKEWFKPLTSGWRYTSQSK